MKCMKCSRGLTADEVGLHKKLMGRGSREFLCIDCLAAYIGCPTEVLKKKTEEFRAMGCMLFPPGK